MLNIHTCYQDILYDVRDTDVLYMPGVMTPTEVRNTSFSVQPF